MAYDSLDPSDVDTFVAGADLSAKQFHLVWIEQKAGAAKVVTAATAGQRIDGVLQDKPNADGVACLVAGSGISKVVMGGAASPGDLLTAKNDGRAATASATAYQRIGKALESAAVDGDVIAMLIKNYGPNVP